MNEEIYKLICDHHGLDSPDKTISSGLIDFITRLLFPETMVHWIDKSLFSKSPDKKMLVEVKCEHCDRMHTSRMDAPDFYSLCSDMRSNRTLGYDDSWSFNTFCNKCKRDYWTKTDREGDDFVEMQYGWILRPRNHGQDNDIFHKLTSLPSFVDDFLFRRIKKMPYQDFLKTRYWDAVSYYVKHVNDKTCNRCRATRTRLEVHHKTYDNHGLEHKFWKSDLECLCHDCHSKEHSK